MATTTAETILQASRRWLKEAARPGGLTDAQVIPADDAGPRPPMPYLTVKLTSVDVAVGEDEDLPALADVLTVIGGVTGDVYEVTVQDVVVRVVRRLAQTHAAFAEVLAAELRVVPHVYAEADGARVIVSARHAVLVTTTASPLLTLQIGEEPVLGVAGQRRAGLSVQGFGRETAAWIERAALRLRSPAILDGLAADGLTVRAVGSIEDVSRLIDTATEGRFLREFEIDYAVRGDPARQVGAELFQASIRLERYRDASDAFTIEVTTEAE